MESQRTFKTPQEEFWASEFGEAYIGRNADARFVDSNIALFARALRRAQGIRDCIEFGANIGLNLCALKQLYPGLLIDAIEINATAARRLEAVLPRDSIYSISILEFAPKRTYDLVLAKGVLIHINPDFLRSVYEKLHLSCRRYLLICEYYNPTPASVVYHGFADRLFKRDFAGEMLDQYRDLALIDYGFVYHRDPRFSPDDVNWFLLEKTSAVMK
jgi:pseudaminic acid biosynthesis-associated methylase